MRGVLRFMLLGVTLALAAAIVSAILADVVSHLTLVLLVTEYVIIVCFVWRELSRRDLDFVPLKRKEASPVKPGAAERVPSLLDLEGMGAEIWKGVDAQQYVNELRDEWDAR